MKVLELGDNDLIGKRFNGHNLHVYLRECGVETKHLIMQTQSDVASSMLKNGAIAADESLQALTSIW